MHRETSASRTTHGVHWSARFITRAGQSADAIAPGTHIAVPRRGYMHHGIYVGNGRVVHYGGVVGKLIAGSVVEVPLADFARGCPVGVRLGHQGLYDPFEVVRRARMRLGESRYNVFTNNCEHFCEWCVRGEPRSYQVEDFVGRCATTLRKVIKPFGRCACAPRDLGAAGDSIPSCNGFALVDEV